MIIDISKIQALLVNSHLDGWLFTDFHGRDPITNSFLQLTDRHCTRRLFYYIPASGSPVKLLSAIEPLLLDHLPVTKILYRGRAGLDQALGRLLTPGMQLACQYSPGGNVPTASTLDAGLAEYLGSFGPTLVSSADLLQHFGAVLTDRQIRSHQQAGVIIHRILDQTFSWIRSHLDQGDRIDEWMLLKEMEQLIARERIHMDSPPFFGIDEHACDPGYEPKEHGSKLIQEGSRLIIDIAGRLPEEDAIYYDVSWCMNIGSTVDPEYQRLFDIVAHARSQAVAFIRQQLEADIPVHGCEVDALIRSIFQKEHLDPYIMHRTGHNIGHTCHGVGANLDDYETHDDRCLLPGTLFSVEPGLYTDRYGVRLEYDVHITPDKKIRIYGPIQQELLIV